MAKLDYPPTYDQFSRPVPEGIDNKEPSRTKQEFAEEADINNIMERYTFTGQLPEGVTGTYGDFSEMGTFHEAQEIVAKAQQQFEALPGPVRDRFDHDPAKMLEFVHDPKNYDEARALGLLKQEITPPAPRAAGKDPAPQGPPAAPQEPPKA